MKISRKPAHNAGSYESRRRSALSIALFASFMLLSGCSSVDSGGSPDGSGQTDPAGSSNAYYGWELTASNTGLARSGLTCDELPLYTGSDRPTSGTVISDVRIIEPLVLSAGDITIERSCIQPTHVGHGNPVLTTTDNNTGQITTARVVIRDSEIDGSLLPDSDAAWSTGFLGVADLLNNYIHHLGSGIGLMNTGTQLSSRIEGNYVTDLLAYGDPATTGNHSDAFTIRDFDTTTNESRTVIVSNNRFDCDSPSATGAFFIQTYAGNINNLTLEGNLLEGGGYQLGLEENYGHAYSNVRSINNRFSGTGWGATYRTGGPGWTQWSDNHIIDPGAPESRGQSVGEP